MVFLRKNKITSQGMCFLLKTSVLANRNDEAEHVFPHKTRSLIEVVARFLECFIDMSRKETSMSKNISPRKGM